MLIVKQKLIKINILNKNTNKKNLSIIVKFAWLNPKINKYSNSI